MPHPHRSRGERRSPLSVGELVVEYGRYSSELSGGQTDVGKYLDAALKAHPRGAGFKGELAAFIRAEAWAVPGGRFAFMARLGFPLAVRLAPFDD